MVGPFQFFAHAVAELLRNALGTGHYLSPEEGGGGESVVTENLKMGDRESGITENFEDH